VGPASAVWRGQLFGVLDVPVRLPSGHFYKLPLKQDGTLGKFVACWCGMKICKLCRRQRGSLEESCEGGMNVDRGDLSIGGTHSGSRNTEAWAAGTQRPGQQERRGGLLGKRLAGIQPKSRDTAPPVHALLS